MMTYKLHYRCWVALLKYTYHLKDIRNNLFMVKKKKMAKVIFKELLILNLNVREEKTIAKG